MRAMRIVLIVIGPVSWLQPAMLAAALVVIALGVTLARGGEGQVSDEPSPT